MTKPLKFTGRPVEGLDFVDVIRAFGYDVRGDDVADTSIIGVLASMAERIENLEREVERLGGSNV